MWLASKIQGHRNPFGKPLTEYNHAELDFILEMSAIDDPESYVFHRGGDVPLSPSQVSAAWFKVLRGKALLRHTLGQAIEVANKAVEAFNGRFTGGLKPGITQRGKAINVNAGDSNNGQSEK